MRVKIARIITDGAASVYGRGAVLAALLFLGACGAGAPVQEMSDARQAIAVAEEAGAAITAADALGAAQRYLQSAEEKLRRRAYRGAREDAKLAKNKALEALSASENAPKDHKR